LRNAEPQRSLVNPADRHNDAMTRLTCRAIH
jgi:hypothetical protein